MILKIVLSKVYYYFISHNLYNTFQSACRPGHRTETTLLKNVLIFKCYFLRKSHNTEQAVSMMLFPSGSHFTANSTEAMQIECPAEELSILVQPDFKPSINVS